MNFYDCRDFRFQEDAQLFLTPGDPHRLDLDFDGIACEDLPRRGPVFGNAAPRAVPDEVRTAPGEAVDIAVLANDRDPDGTLEAVYVWAAPANGRFDLLGDGTIRYTPDRGFEGVDQFEYLVIDDRGGHARATAIVSVSADPGTGQGLSVAAARTVAYLYEAALDRNGAIDAGGLNYWIDQREAGLSERGLAFEFLKSREFEAAFGDPLDPTDPRHLDDFAFVTALYENVLDREADDGGRDFWLSVLARPEVDRADLLLNFAASRENVEGSPAVATLEEVEPGAWDFVG